MMVEPCAFAGIADIESHSLMHHDRHDLIACRAREAIVVLAGDALLVITVENRLAGVAVSRLRWDRPRRVELEVVPAMGLEPL